MASRAKSIMRRSSLYPTGKALSVAGSKSKVGFIDEKPPVYQKRTSLPCLERSRYDTAPGF